jgi:hypothetical protein
MLDLGQRIFGEVRQILLLESMFEADPVIPDGIERLAEP